MKASATFLSLLSLLVVGCGSSDSKTPRSPETQAQFDAVTGTWKTACEEWRPGTTQQLSMTFTNEGHFNLESRYYPSSDCSGPTDFDTFMAGTFSFASTSPSSPIRLENIQEWSTEGGSRRNVDSHLVDVTAEITTSEEGRLRFQITNGTRVYSDGDSTTYGRGAFGDSELFFHQ